MYELHRLAMSRIAPGWRMGTGDDGHECGMYQLPSYWSCNVLHYKWLNLQDSTKVLAGCRVWLRLQRFRFWLR